MFLKGKHFTMFLKIAGSTLKNYILLQFPVDKPNFTFYLRKNI